MVFQRRVPFLRGGTSSRLEVLETSDTGAEFVEAGVDGKSHATFADFRAAIEDVRHPVPTTHTGSLEKLMTLHIQDV
ncbi:MAG: hypothetical protein LC104_02125 [Bacteroidales bacterium]|nr:hypothetical protein [Bacteroidales bacterium]